MTIDTSNLCSHLWKKLFKEDGEYHRLWMTVQDDPELTVGVAFTTRFCSRKTNSKWLLVGEWLAFVTVFLCL